MKPRVSRDVGEKGEIERRILTDNRYHLWLECQTRTMYPLRLDKNSDQSIQVILQDNRRLKKSGAYDD